jgi:hypothetical protein
MTITQIFSRLWDDYTSQNPDVKKVYDLFVVEGETVVNDHIAFRTFDDARINVEVLSKVFIKAGYEEKGQYVFEKKHLNAKHFEHINEKDAPRVFISELKTKDFSSELQAIVKECINKIPTALLLSDELIFSGNVWGTPSFKVYEKLRAETEYAAWLYVNGFTANHFTVSVNHLKKYDSIQKVNEFIKTHGFLMNDAEGEIQGTPEELLEQSSTRAAIKTVPFTEGNFDVTSCYYEFARRYPDSNGQIYSGFIAKSADKIFQSTNLYKKSEFRSQNSE